MPIKFSKLVSIPFAKATKLVGLYKDDNGDVANCIVETDTIAVKSDLKDFVTTQDLDNDLKNYVTNSKHTTDLSKYVTLNTAQTIDSTKTFTQPITIQLSTDMNSNTFKDYIFLKDTSLDYTVTSQFNKTYYTNSLRDKNGKYIGYTEIKYHANGSSSHSMCARTRRDNGNEISASIGVTVNKDGTIKTSSPTPPINDNSTQIATTEFVKYILFSSGNGLATFSKGKNGFYKFANGLIIQWGSSQANQRRVTVTLPTKFTSKDSYQVVTQFTKESAQCSYVINKTSTNFQWDRYTGIGDYEVLWMAIGY